MLYPYLFTYGNFGLIKNSGPANLNDWVSPTANEVNITATKIVKGLPVRGGSAAPSGLFWSLDSLIRVSYNPTTISSGNVIDPNYKPAMFNAVQGNDDFALYMQHQQGMAGAKGLIQALNGTGQMHPDTVKTKSGTRYANLVKNVPSDRPQIKADLIKALNNGDQKTAAGLFLSMWKEKWFSKQKQALAAINLPKNASVKDAITRSSAKYKVPFDFAITVAMIESGLNPLAHGPVYKGLYAMRPESNYGGVVKPMGENWKDPYVNAEAGIALLADNIKQFKKSLGKDLATLNLGGWTQGLA
jgi:soluble lytic murein transglycosylase-like protein